jgi:hypothetical protein
MSFFRGQAVLGTYMPLYWYGSYRELLERFSELISNLYEKQANKFSIKHHINKLFEDIE